MDKQSFTQYLTYLLIGSSLFILGIVVGASLNLREDDSYIRNLYPSINTEASQKDIGTFDVEIKLLKPKTIDRAKVNS